MYPRRSIDSEIKTEKDAKPPHCALYELSPTELKSRKFYVQKLISKGKVRLSNSTHRSIALIKREMHTIERFC